MSAFLNQVAVVSGASGGIGGAIALVLSREAAEVCIVARSARLQSVAARIHALGGRADVCPTDLTKEAEIEELVEYLGKEFGRLDILVHSAASGYNRPAMLQKPKGWDWTMNINARALLFGAQRAAPMMESRGGSYIVSLTSAGSTRVLPDYVAVGASKAAVESLTRYLGVELISKTINVNAVSPGVVQTEALHHFAAAGGQKTILQRFIDEVPAGRLVTAEDVAGVVRHRVYYSYSGAAHQAPGNIERQRPLRKGKRRKGEKAKTGLHGFFFSVPSYTWARG